jgi:glycosyltransferase involved in cell wall biosynthesis
MKVLFVHENLGEFGGAEGYVELTAKGLRQRGHEADLLFRQSTGRNVEAWRELFGECFCLPSRANSEWVEAILDRARPDIVFLHNFSDLDLIEFLLESGIPVIRMVHDHAMYCMRSYKYNYFTRKICTRPASGYCVFPCLASIARDRESPLGLKWVSLAEKRREIGLNQQCAAILAYSDYQKQELIRNGFDARKIFLSSPMRTHDADPGTASFSERNLVLFAGQVIRGKGVDALLRALAKVRVPFECLILGEGNHRAYCEKLARKLGLAGRVIFKGYLLPAEIRSFYLDASVFAMSSLWPEPFGMAGPEAMRYGLPVVAFRAGAIGEWLRDGQNGFPVPWNDTAAFAMRLEQLLQNKELARRMGATARESINSLEANRHLEPLERLFERVLQTFRMAQEPGKLLAGKIV